MNTLDATRSTKTAAITLIGMAGAGKSTIGVLLAKRLVKRFVDTDLVIQETEQRSLQDILNRDGYLELRAVEARVLQCVDPAGAVVATGGSAVYSVTAMAHLSSATKVVYLKVPLAEVIRRIGDYSGRGIAKPPEQSLEDTFKERQRKYERWADLTVDATRPVETVVNEICTWLKQQTRP
ncbi:MAG: shikimate kinase [Gammaproteobacteria bacterium]|nr:shikimate kinase [Gammaproteobacteria bacterium]